MRNTLLFLIVGAAIVLIILGCVIAYLISAKAKKAAATDTVFLTKKANAGYDKWLNVYTVLINFKPTAGFAQKLFQQFNVMDPVNIKKSKTSAAQLCVLIYGLSVTLFMAVMLITPSLTTLLLVAWSIYILATQMVNNKMSKANVALMEAFNKYLSEVRHSFINIGMVDEALYDVLDRVPSAMGGHAKLIYEAMVSDDLEEAIFQYNLVAPNQYFKQFISICSTAIKYGDMKVDKQSLFLINIKELKESIDTDILASRNIKAKFTALPIIAFVPVYALPMIKTWALDSMPQLQKFYAGRWGMLAVLASFAVAFVLYKVVCMLKEPPRVDQSDHPFIYWLLDQEWVLKFCRNYENLNFTKTYELRRLLKLTGSNLNTNALLLKRLGYGALAMFISLFIIVALNINQRSVAMTEMSDLATVTNASDDMAVMVTMGTGYHWINHLSEKDLIEINNKFNHQDAKTYKEAKEGAALALKEYLRVTPIELDEDEAIECIQVYNKYNSADTSLYTLYYGSVGDKPVIPDDMMAERKMERDFNKFVANMADPEYLALDSIYETLAQRIVEHVEDYNNSYFHWYHLIIMYIAGIIFYQLPVILMKVQKSGLQRQMEDEVIQYQSVIMILMHQGQMTVEAILEELNKFSYCFRESLLTCINDLAYGETDALEAMKEAEPFEAFQRLCDNLLAIDKIGIKQAFSEIDIERRNYIEKRKQDVSIETDNKSAVGQFIAFIPFSVIVVLYMVIPIMMESMTGLTSTMAGI